MSISGPVLCGFSDCFDSSVGALPMHAALPLPKAGAATPAKPGAKPPAAPIQARGKVPNVIAQDKSKSPHKRALVSATDAGKRAVAAGKKLAAAAKYNPKAYAPRIPVRAVSVRGDGQIVLGAVTAILTPRQQAAQKKHVAAIAKHARAAKAAQTVAVQAQKTGTAALATVKRNAPFLKKKLEGKTPTRILGDEADRSFLDMLGALPDDGLMFALEVLEGRNRLGVDAQGHYPGEPGYDPTTDPDVTPPPGGGTDPYGSDAGLGSGGLDASTGIVTDDNGRVLYDPSQDPTVVPMPVRDQPLPQSEATKVWKQVPASGIPYLGEKGLPGATFYSYNIAYGGGDGFFWDGSTWYFRGGKTDTRAEDAPDNIIRKGEDPASASARLGLGPIVGNPKQTNGLQGVQWATDAKTWFFQSDYAPSWLTTDIDAKITESNNAAIKANTDAALAKLAQQRLDATAAAEAQAKQEMDIALKQQKADADLAVAQTQADAARATAAPAQEQAQAQLDVQTQQADLAQQQAELQMAQQQAQVQAAAQNSLIQTADVWNQWAAAHPEEAVAQMQQEATDEGDDGDGGGDFDDGSEGADGGEGGGGFDDGAAEYYGDDYEEGQRIVAEDGGGE